MKIRWGMMITDGSGKLGGHVASRNRSGPYLRTLVNPVNPQTTFQQTVRNRLSSFSSGWRLLTQAVIAAWNAATSDFATTTTLAGIRNPTGKNLYTRLNANLASVGIAAIGVPPLPEGAEGVVAGTAVIANGGAKTIAYTGATAASDVQVWATPGVSPGKSFVKSEYRQIGSFTGGTASPIDIATDYEGRFGEPAVGTKVFVKLVAINNTTGENSVGSSTSVIAT